MERKHNPDELRIGLVLATDGYPDVVRQALAEGADPNGMPLIMAIQCDEPGIVRMLINGGAAVVRRRKSDRKTLREVVGAAAGIQFRYRRMPRSRIYAFGYPRIDNRWYPFSTSAKLWKCAAGWSGDDRPWDTNRPGGRGPKAIGIGCRMGIGSSGGGWFTGGFNGTVGGTLWSALSYARPSTGVPNAFDTQRRFGAYLGRDAEKLYLQVRVQPTVRQK